ELAASRRPARFYDCLRPGLLQAATRGALRLRARWLCAGDRGGNGKALLVRCAGAAISALVVWYAGNPEGLGGPCLRDGQNLRSRRVVRNRQVPGQRAMVSVTTGSPRHL